MRVEPMTCRSGTVDNSDGTLAPFVIQNTLTHIDSSSIVYTKNLIPFAFCHPRASKRNTFNPTSSTTPLYDSTQFDDYMGWIMLVTYDSDGHHHIQTGFRYPVVTVAKLDRITRECNRKGFFKRSIMIMFQLPSSLY
jgi:hypothetical protein